MKMHKRLARYGKAFILPVAVFALFSIIAAPRFGLGSLRVVTIQAFLPTLVGFGLYQFMQAGMLDLTVGAQMILSGYIGAICSRQFGLPGLILGCILTSVVLGIINGLLYTFLKLPALVLSMGLIMIYETLAAFLDQGSFITISRHISFLGIPPYSVILTVAALLLFYIINYHTQYALHLKAIGLKETLASMLGVDAVRIKLKVYIVAGLFYGIAALLYISYSGSIGIAYAMGSISMVFQPLMGVLIALELRKFINAGLGVFIGEFSFSVIFSGLIAMGISDTVQKMVTGLFLLLVIIFSTNKERVGLFFHRMRMRHMQAPTAGNSVERM